MTSFLQSESSFLQGFDQSSLLDASIFDQSLQDFLKSSDLTIGDILKGNFSAPLGGASDARSSASSGIYSVATSNASSTGSFAGSSAGSFAGLGPIARPIRGAGPISRDGVFRGHGMKFGTTNALEESFSAANLRPAPSTAVPHEGIGNNSLNEFRGLDLSFTSVPPPIQRQSMNCAADVSMTAVPETSGSPRSNYPFRSPLITSPPPLPFPTKLQGRSFLEKLNRSDSSQSRPNSGGSSEASFDSINHSFQNNNSNNYNNGNNFNTNIGNNFNTNTNVGNQSDFFSPMNNFGAIPPPSQPPPSVDGEDNPIVNSLIGLSSLTINEKPSNVANISAAKQWTHRDLVTTVLKDTVITVQWLTDRRLLVGGRTCLRCGPLVRLEMAHCQRTRHWQTYDQLTWICKNCEASTYLRQGSFFDRPFNVSIVTYVEIIYWWARCMPIDQIAEQTRTRQNFVTLMMCLLREICAFEVGECRLIQGGVKAEVALDPKRGHFKLNKVSCDDYVKSLESAEAMWRLKFGFNAFECILVHLANMYRCG